jgi:hypothetical protein
VIVSSVAVVAAQVDVRARGLGLGAAPERLVDGGRGLGRGGGVDALAPLRVRGRIGGAALRDQAGERGRRLRLQDAVVEGAAERVLEPQEQLDALQAAQADLALERGRRRHRARGPRSPQLFRERAHDLEHAALDLRDRGSRGRRSGLAHGEVTVHSNGQGGERVLEAVTLREIHRIFEITDRLGIHREQLVIPLGPRHPGRVRRMPNGKLEIVVEKDGDFEEWLATLEGEIRKVTG